MDAQTLRSTLIKLMLGTLVLSAGLAVVLILIGTFNDTAWRAIGTLFSAMIHIGLLFAVLSLATGSVPTKSDNLVINSAMTIAIASFFTSIFGIWEIIDGELSVKLYITYAVLLFAILHTKVLMDVEQVYAKVRPYVYVNYGFIVFVAALILGIVYIPESYDLLSGFYGRLLAAAAVIDVTLGIVVAVMHKLYLQQHPELITKHSEQRFAGGRIIVAILLFFFVIWPLMSFFFRLATY